MFFPTSLVALSSVGLAWALPNITPSGLFPRATSGCPPSGLISCQSTPPSNLCCFESPGGLLLQTQFWDTSGPGINLPTTWTVHGLWPDNCDGTFTTNCDSSRDYTNISAIIQNAGQTELLNFMNTFWLDINGNNQAFWAHEWAAHGTCYSTLKPQCFAPGTTPGTDAVDFFLTVERVFKTLPTYNFLANAGITPTTSRTFTLTQLTSALKAAAGVTPALDCSGSAVNQISWYFNLQGSIIDGTFIPIDAPKAGSCPSSGITYPPKPGSPTSTSSTVTSTTGTSTTPTPTGTSVPVPPSSHLIATDSSGAEIGVLLSKGTLSAQTAATYTATTSGSGFTLTTSKGSCGVSGSTFSCGSGFSSVFGSTSSGSNVLLTFNGSPAFTSSGVPSGIQQLTVLTDSSGPEAFSIVFQAA